MLSIRACVLFATSWLLVLPAPAGAAGKKIHIGAKLGEILNLETDFVPNDGTTAVPFTFDGNGPNFTVPDGFSFVVTDVNFVGFGGGAFGDVYSVNVRLSQDGDRNLPARFLGAAHARSFTTGYVVPPGVTPTVLNNPASIGGVLVQMQGYLVKGTGLAPNEGF
jgi:hypothetical protein